MGPGHDDTELCGDRGARDAGGDHGRHDGNGGMVGADRLASGKRRGGGSRQGVRSGRAGRPEDHLAAVAGLQRAPGAGLSGAVCAGAVGVHGCCGRPASRLEPVFARHPEAACQKRGDIAFGHP